MYLLLAMLGLCCCVDFSLVLASRGYSLVGVCGFFTVVASCGAWALGCVDFRNSGSQALEHRFHSGGAQA